MIKDEPKPEWIPGTTREWKQKKRREWKKVLKAIDDFRFGCAFTPAYDRMDNNSENAIRMSELERAANDITKGLSFKEWGR